MKAQILKIAGVKSEKEFYKKFPTEEAFMKKHGEELKKAQYGAYVAGQDQPEVKPIHYDDLYQNAMSNVTGVSREEKARQEAINAMRSGKSDNTGGLGDLLGQAAKIAAPMLESGAMGKNGKKLKKAQTGLNEGFFNNTTSDYGASQSKDDGFSAAVAKAGGTGTSSSSGSGFDWKGKLKEAAPVIANQLGPIIGSVQQLEQNQKDIKKANQWADIAQISAQAAASRPEISKRRYARPEDNLVTGANPLGKRDSLLAAQNGAEIQNTYNPGNLYTDLGYEPLNDSNVKQFAMGGDVADAASSTGGGFNYGAFSGIAGGIGGALGSAAGKGTGKGGAASSLGSIGGSVIGNALLPGVGGLIGSAIGGFAGGLFDADDQNRLQEAQDRQTAAINQATLSAGASNLQKANKAFMEDGGYMNPEYNPQVIAKFGDYTMDQLLAPPHDADMLRAGGHLKEYTPPSARAMYTGRDLPYQMEEGGMMPSTNMMFETDRHPVAKYGTQMAMGGDLQVHRGKAETLSYNPFLPDGGETIMFRGPSHDNGGMPISFGNNGVEVEGGEPAVKLQDGGSPDGNLVVYGNMIIPDYGVAELNDPKAKGKKFKHYVDELSKVEAKQNKLINKTTELINNADANDQFDKLSLNTGQANLIGTTMKLKDIAEKKKTAAAVQNAILDTAEEHGLESDALAKGKIKYAKANDPYAEFGAKLKPGGKASKTANASLKAFVKSIPFAERKQMAEANGIKNFTGSAAQNESLMAIANQSSANPYLPMTLSDFVTQIPYAERKEMAKNMGISKYSGTADQNAFLFKKTQASESAAPLVSRPTMKDIKLMPTTSLTPQLATEALNKSIAAGNYKVDTTTGGGSEEEKKESPWDTILTGVNSMLPFLRPSNQIPLDPSQLSGELYAMAQNQEEPVFAQSYQPLLTQTSNISLQDQLNEITSQSRAAERMAQGNPAALAMIASQAAEAKNKVLGEQFRMNQGEAQRVAETNRQTMNEAMKTNLGLYDQQQQRAAQAKSNTKMQQIAALNSINDKIAKQKAENRQVALMENLYNYRFSPNGVAYNLNPLANFAPYGSGTNSSKATGDLEEGKDFSYNKAGKIIGIHSTKDDGSGKRNGAIVKAIKGL